MRKTYVKYVAIASGTYINPANQAPWTQTEHTQRTIAPIVLDL